MQLLIVALLVANLAVGGARIAFADLFEGGSPPKLGFGVTGHYGCADLITGDVRVFRHQHTAFGTNPPFDACTPSEYRIITFFDHDP